MPTSSKPSTPSGGKRMKVVNPSKKDVIVGPVSIRSPNKDRRAQRRGAQSRHPGTNDQMWAHFYCIECGSSSKAFAKEATLVAHIKAAHPHLLEVDTTNDKENISRASSGTDCDAATGRCNAVHAVQEDTPTIPLSVDDHTQSRHASPPIRTGSVSRSNSFAPSASYSDENHHGSNQARLRYRTDTPLPLPDREDTPMPDDFTTLPFDETRILPTGLWGSSFFKDRYTALDGPLGLGVGAVDEEEGPDEHSDTETVMDEDEANTGGSQWTESFVAECGWAVNA